MRNDEGVKETMPTFSNVIMLFFTLKYQFFSRVLEAWTQSEICTLVKSDLGNESSKVVYEAGFIYNFIKIVADLCYFLYLLMPSCEHDQP